MVATLWLSTPYSLRGTFALLCPAFRAAAIRLSIFLSNGTNPPQRLSDTVAAETIDEQDGDMQLVRAAGNGNIEAFESLVRKYQARTMNIAFRMTGDYDDACEITQETFLSAFKAIRGFRGEAQFSTWIYGICLNHARNRLKLRHGRSRHEAYSLDDPVGEEEKIGREARSGGPSIAEQVEQRELQRQIQKCIGSLDRQHREVLVLRDIEGFAYDEIGRILDLPDGTIKSRLFRAREALRTKLKAVIGDY